MNLTNNRGWMHKARKEGKTKGDVDEKFEVIRILWEKFGLHGLTGEVITDGLNHRHPDIFIKSEQIAVELDGEYHGGGDKISMSKQTMKRNAFYNEMGIQCIMINKEMTEGYDTNLVIECLRLGGLKVV